MRRKIKATVESTCRTTLSGGSVKDWEIIADRLSGAGWSLGWVSVIDSQRRTIWIVDAHGCGKRFIVRADDILTAFLELETGIHEFAVSLVL